MAKRMPTGRNEVGMLSDIKVIAESVGTRVMGFPVEWRVETELTKSAQRPDVEIRRADGSHELLASGEAKKPETPGGLHPFVASEVNGAIGKAKALGGTYAFTTNFLQVALFDVEKHDEHDYLRALLGDRIDLIGESETRVANWWVTLTPTRREALVQEGLESFFNQLRRLRLKQELESQISKDEVYLTIFKQSADSIIAEALPVFIDSYGNGSLPEPVVQEATERGFDLSKGDIARYFVAQAVAEVLTSGLFYETVRPSFSLGPILSGLKPATSALMTATLTANLTEATRFTGDYETIFGLSQGARWALEVENGSLRAFWLELFEALDGIKFEEVNSEILGVIFERLISAERRQDMGQHYTQTRLARAMTDWAVNDPGDTVVDFCAGGGTFLVEAYTKLRKERGHTDVLEQIFGNDLDSFAVHLSTVNLATRSLYKGRNFPAVSNRDALALRPGDAAVEVTPDHGEPYRLDYPDSFSVVLGNPPYDESATDPARYRADLAALTKPTAEPVLPTGMPDHINLAGWFVLLAAAWLRPGGRIALVLPAAILQNEKHATLVAWLRRRFDMSVWHTESDVWFSDARVAPVVIFMRARTTSETDFGRLNFVNVLEPLSGGVDAVNGFPRPVERHLARDLGDLPAGEDALIAGTMPDELVLFESLPGAVRIGSIQDASVYRGNKLGHAFFKLQDREPTSDKKVRSLLGHGMPIRLNRDYLSPLFRSPKDESTGEFNSALANWWILSAPAQLPKGGDLEKYVRAGERLGVADKPSVKAKGQTWWSAKWRSSRIAVGAHPQFQPQVWWSNKPFVTTDNFQAITLSDSVARDDQELVAATLASAFGALSALYRSNEVGCEGVRWVSTSNLEAWFSLDWTKVESGDKTAVLSAYRTFRTLKASKLYEMPGSTSAAWAELTVAVARAAGSTNPETLGADAVEEAIATTLRRREREVRATSGRTRAGSTGAAKLIRDVRAFTETMVSFRDVVEALSGGDSTLKLKSQEVEATLFDVLNESERVQIGNQLVTHLGEGFEAAPVWEESTVTLVEALYSAVVEQFVHPDADGSHTGAFGYVAQIVRDQVTKSLSAAVRKRLT
ncbi:N-6 DNA methylase [Agrococcus sp. Marseille-Q4369]|uniref:N-6 DNA methylase n=1 Tax=Agrococcus sp. Marseille-Q4369 TaxID=2810513 RepID=UPI001B8BBAEE|nr:N-6 DNA methylase [Agrococcus sp. Marseille-Q4369]QUW17869.1 N-6 DNA methylase [Agrococcus sp. Marseille-Q4369]